MNRYLLSALILLGAPGLALAQISPGSGVSQYGTVTANDIATWRGPGVIQDGSGGGGGGTISAPFIINGNTAAPPAPVTGTILELVGKDAQKSILSNYSYSGATGGNLNLPPTFSCLYANGTGASPTTTKAGDNTCDIDTRAYDGTRYGNNSTLAGTAGFHFLAGSDFSGTNHETYIEIECTALNAFAQAPGGCGRVTANGFDTQYAFFTHGAWPGLTTAGYAGADGMVMDYDSPNGRFSVGSADGFLWQNNFQATPLALMSLDSVGNLVSIGSGTFNNIYIGPGSNSDGSNVAIGAGTPLVSNTTGVQSTAVGYQALKANTTGQVNTAFGFNALSVSVQSSENVAIGADALGSFTGVGAGCTYSGGSPNPCQANTAIGQAALQKSIYSTKEVAIGWGASYFETHATGNTSVGYAALYTNVTGNNNTALGLDALNLVTGSGNVAIGYLAGSALTTQNSTVILGGCTGSGAASTTVYLCDGAAGLTATLTTSGEILPGSLVVTTTENIGNDPTPSGTLDVYNGAATSTTPLANIIERIAVHTSGADATINFTDTLAHNGYFGMAGGNLYWGADTATPQMKLDTGGKFYLLTAPTTTTPASGAKYLCRNATTGVIEQGSSCS